MASPRADAGLPLPIFPQLQRAPRVLALRVAAMFRILVSLLCLHQEFIYANQLMHVSNTFISHENKRLGGL